MVMFNYRSRLAGMNTCRGLRQLVRTKIDGQPLSFAPLAHIGTTAGSLLA